MLLRFYMHIVYKQYGCNIDFENVVNAFFYLEHGYYDAGQ